MYRLGVAPYALQDSWINKNDFRKSGSTRQKQKIDHFVRIIHQELDNLNSPYFLSDTPTLYNYKYEVTVS